MDTTMVVVWFVALVVLLVIEAVTLGLASIWFVLGALAALICALLGAPIWLQIFWFVAVSVVTLVLTRPLLMKYVNSRVRATNADRTVAKTGVVVQTIDNLAATGSVKVDGKFWTARSESGEVIPEGEMVAVLRIEGVKVIVAPTGVTQESEAETV